MDKLTGVGNISCRWFYLLKLYLLVMKYSGRDGLAGKMLGDGDVITGILYSQFCYHMTRVFLKVTVLYTKLHSKTVSGKKKAVLEHVV